MNQIFQDGKVVTIDNVEFECTSVSYQNQDGKRYNFTYQFRPKADVDAERKAALEAEELAKANEKAVEEANNA